MSTAEIKYQIISSITEIEDVLILDKVKKYLASLKNIGKENILGFDSNNNPLSNLTIVENHQNAMERISNGQFTNHEDVIKDAVNW